MSLLGLARTSALQGLDRAEHLLARGAKAGLLEARLTPDMLLFFDQIAIAGSFARRAVLGLVEAELSTDLDWDARTVGDLLSAIRLEVQAVDGPVLHRIMHSAGEADLVQPPEDYLLTFALPNMWFHLSMAYAILRAEGVAIGKADFDGLHRYGVE